MPCQSCWRFHSSPTPFRFRFATLQGKKLLSRSGSMHFYGIIQASLRAQATTMNFQLFSTEKPSLQTTRVVLTEPFVRHAAGHVFELDATTGVSGWEDDERLREKLNFSNKGIYFLPDGGNGYGAELPVSATRPCPAGVFEEIDLSTGPCRITGSFLGTSAAASAAAPTSLKYQIGLLEINGINAQGIEMAFDRKPLKIVLTDLLRNEVLRNIPADSHSLQLDFTGLTPGFYQLMIVTSEQSFHFVRIFKAFPLLVTFPDRSGRFLTQKTLY